MFSVFIVGNDDGDYDKSVIQHDTIYDMNGDMYIYEKTIYIK